jgi:hypothetical protein
MRHECLAAKGLVGHNNENVNISEPRLSCPQPTSSVLSKHFCTDVQKRCFTKAEPGSPGEKENTYLALRSNASLSDQREERLLQMLAVVGLARACVRFPSEEKERHHTRSDLRSPIYKKIYGAAFPVSHK